MTFTQQVDWDRAVQSIRTVALLGELFAVCAAEEQDLGEVQGLNCGLKRL